jgi:WD40-like Beta Propeller Repeat
VSSAGFARWVLVRMLFAALSVGLVVSACGGGGGSADDGGGGNGGGTPGSAAGMLYWIAGYDGATLDLAGGTKERTEVARLSVNSEGQLGYGGGMFTDVETTGILPYEVTVNLRDVAPNPYALRSKLGPFPLNGFVSGPVQPSPDGRLFAMFTRESSVDYVYVFDAALDIVFKLEGHRYRSWLGSDRVVVTKGSSLYTVTVSNSPVVTRVGPEGLGLPNETADQPSVSPDGKSIAFTQGSAVWRINVDGSGLTQLTKPRFGAGWPSWSPDGSRVVVSSTECETFGGGIPSVAYIYVVSATATNQDLDTLDFVTSSCGPVYWLPS